MGIFIHLVTLNGIWCSTSPGTMKERCYTGVAEKFPSLFFAFIERHGERGGDDLAARRKGKFGCLTGSGYRRRYAVC